MTVLYQDIGDTSGVLVVALSGLEDVKLTAVPWDNVVLRYITPSPSRSTGSPTVHIAGSASAGRWSGCFFRSPMRRTH